jgi:hypothetical protein
MMKCLKVALFNPEHKRYLTADPNGKTFATDNWVGSTYILRAYVNSTRQKSGWLSSNPIACEMFTMSSKAGKFYFRSKHGVSWSFLSPRTTQHNRIRAIGVSIVMSIDLFEYQREW